jgi:hypothetical protein
MLGFILEFDYLVKMPFKNGLATRVYASHRRIPAEAGKQGKINMWSSFHQSGTKTTYFQMFVSQLRLGSRGATAINIIL